MHVAWRAEVELEALAVRLKQHHNSMEHILTWQQCRIEFETIRKHMDVDFSDSSLNLQRNHPRKEMPEPLPPPS